MIVPVTPSVDWVAAKTKINSGEWSRCRLTFFPKENQDIWWVSGNDRFSSCCLTATIDLKDSPLIWWYVRLCLSHSNSGKSLFADRIRMTTSFVEIRLCTRRSRSIEFEQKDLRWRSSCDRREMCLFHVSIGLHTIVSEHDRHSRNDGVSSAHHSQRCLSSKENVSFLFSFVETWTSRWD